MADWLRILASALADKAINIRVMMQISLFFMLAEFYLLQKLVLFHWVKSFFVFGAMSSICKVTPLSSIGIL